MPVFYIYRNGEKIASEQFDSEFTIIETDDPDERADWFGNIVKPLLNGRRPVVWVGRSSKGSISFSGFVVDPCEVLIDNVLVPNERETNVIDFTGKEARFLLHDYEFVCRFPPCEERDQST